MSEKEEKLKVEELKQIENPDALMAQLLETVQVYCPTGDMEMLKKAYQLAAEAHKDQKRKSGEPYIIHPLHVAQILAELQLDFESIAGGLLHDVVEDTDYSREDIARIFSPEIALLVDGVTKLTQISWNADKVELQAENLRKMFLAMVADIRVILIKLADRLHNMRTLEFMRREKQVEKARETMEIYAPIAQRLGISKIKTELDDLALRYLKPDVYEELREAIDVSREERDAFVQSIVKEVKTAIIAEGIEAEVNGRAKHFFSIYKKMVNQRKTLDQIYDLFAVRIIVNTTKECYAALGVIHGMYHHVPGRFKDYITLPKSNKYQSLHTTLIGRDGRLFEIQIRTKDMHRTAEYGIAAHWKYKEGDKARNVTAGELEDMNWLRQILEYHEDLNNHDFLEEVKSELNLFSDFVYCFTPTGDVKELPAGSTPVDFAYYIHSAVGNKMVGAKVNGKVVPIDYVLKSGDRVQIQTSQNSKGPSRDWLKFVKSSQARNKINQWFKSEFKEDNIVRGRELVEKYCKAKSIVLSQILTSEGQEKVMLKYGFRAWDAVLAAIGHGGLKEGQVVNKLLDVYNATHQSQMTDADVQQMYKQESEKERQIMKSKGGFIVNGTFDSTARCSKCCNPLPGDEIVGFITRGRGVTVHRTDCQNILHLPEMEKGRLTDVEWVLPENKENLDRYLVEMNVYAEDRTGLYVDASKLLSEMNVDVSSFNYRETKKKGTVTLSIGCYVKDTFELNHVVEKMYQLPGVLNVERSNG